MLAIASFGLSRPWQLPVLVCQAGFYGLAGVDRWIPATWPVKRVSSLSRTVVVLLAAAMFAVRFVITGTGHLWRETEVQRPLETQRKAEASARFVK